MLFLITLATLCCFCVSFLLWIQLKWTHEDAKIGVPGPPCIPLLGNIHLLWGFIQEKRLPDIIHTLINTYGDTIRLRLGTKLFIFTRDVKIIEVVVNSSKFYKSDDYKIYEPWFGDGLVNANGEKWQKMRKLLTPAFHFQILERFIPIYEEQGKIFLNKIQKLKDGSVIDVLPWFHSYALDVVSESSMGIKLNAQRDPHSKFIVANKELFDTMCYRFYYPLYQIDWIWKLTSHYKLICDRIAYVHRFVDDVIDKRRDKLLSEMSDIEERPALLDILLQSTIDGEPLSNKSIRDEINTFIVAGHESTGTAMGFIAYMLAKYPEAQEKVYNEIKEHQLHIHGKTLKIRDVNRLSFMDCVIKESLRLNPIMPCALKQCSEDIRFGNLFLPANTVIVTAIKACHLYDKYFENPYVFNPNRWNNEVTSDERNPYAYQPFSAGLRSCIGQKFGVLEIKTLFIEILREYKIHLVSQDFEMDLRNTTLTYSENGIQVSFEKRNK